MKTFDESFISILEEIIESGDRKDCRVDGVETLSVFNRILECSDSEGFNSLPISQLRKIHYKGAIIEMLWILGLHRKDFNYAGLPLTNVRYLNDNNVKYWNPWANQNGDLGRVYGAQLVDWDNRINQIQNIIDKLRENPDDRRLVVSMWNPAELNFMALPPCHYAVEFYSRPSQNGRDTRRVLDCRWIQRSCDMILGIPYNAIMYTILNKIVAACTGHIPGVVTGCLGNCHVYSNQIEEAKELIKRYYSEQYNDIKKNKPHFRFSDRIIRCLYDNQYCNLDDFAIDGSDFGVIDYQSLPELKVAVNV